MDIEYKVNAPITTQQFIDLLSRSTLGERRPIDDRECMDGMVANSNLTPESVISPPTPCRRT